MDMQALTSRVAQGPQALGGGMRRPVDFGRILYGQHQWHLGQAAVGRLDVAAQEVLRLDGVIRKETIGGFEHGSRPTGFGQRGRGMLGESRGQFDHPLRTAQVTQLRISKFPHGPGGVIDKATHA